MPGEWRQFVMNLESIEAEHAEAALFKNGALSVTLTDAGDTPVLEPAPGDTPLWTDTQITALFDPSINFVNLRSELLTSLGLRVLPPNHVETVAERAWEREWLKNSGPVKFGRRLWVIPWGESAPVANDVVVRLDPGLAFGSGAHATTALCLEWLDSIDLCGKTMLDFGCGSGILSIAACKLGAMSVDGVDIDLQAVTASRQNGAINDVADRFTVSMARTDTSTRYDVVVANILAGTLIENALELCGWLKPGGVLALSGILNQQIDAVQTAYTGLIDFGPNAVQDNWARLSGTRR